MRIILDNIIYSLQHAGGISIYWTELIKRTQKKYTTFFEYKNKNLFKKQLAIQTQVESNIPIPIVRYLPFLRKLPSKSIFHSSYYRVCLQKDIINITTVHDFTYEYFKTGLAKYVHHWQKSFAIKYSDGIICISENTKKDLLYLYPTIDRSKIKVIYNGVGEEFQRYDNPLYLLKDKYEILLDKKYILFIGARSSYKNFPLVIETIKFSYEYHLVVIGGEQFSKDEKEMIDKIQDRIYHFRDISARDLNILYNNAFCLLYPSSYEGFGIPLVEAMKAGCPVVGFNSSSIPEVIQDAGFLIDELIYENILNVLKKLENQEERSIIVNKGLERSKIFSWNHCYDETSAFYHEIWNKKFGE